MHCKTFWTAKSALIVIPFRLSDDQSIMQNVFGLLQDYVPQVRSAWLVWRGSTCLLSLTRRLLGQGKREKRGFYGLHLKAVLKVMYKPISLLSLWVGMGALLDLHSTDFFPECQQEVGDGSSVAPLLLILGFATGYSVWLVQVGPKSTCIIFCSAHLICVCVCS